MTDELERFAWCWRVCTHGFGVKDEDVGLRAVVRRVY